MEQIYVCLTTTGNCYCSEQQTDLNKKLGVKEKIIHLFSFQPYMYSELELLYRFGKKCPCIEGFLEFIGQAASFGSSQFLEELLSDDLGLQVKVKNSNATVKYLIRPEGFVDVSVASPIYNEKAEEFSEYCRAVNFNKELNATQQIMVDIGYNLANQSKAIQKFWSN